MVHARRAHGTLDGQDQEGQRDEGLRQHHGGRAEGEAEPAEPPRTSEQIQQRDAAHHRRQHQRHRDDGAEHGGEPGAGTGDVQRERNADDDAEQRGDETGAEREEESREGCLRRHIGQERRPLHTRDESDQRQDQEGQTDRSGDGERPRSVPSTPCCTHGAPKPKSARIFCPASDSTNATNASAASAFGASESAAIG